MTIAEAIASGKLKRIERTLRGDVSGLIGNKSHIWGDVTGLRGDVSYLIGDVTGLRGTVSYLIGDVSYLIGDVTGLYGTVSGLRVHLPKGFRLMAKDPKQCSRLQNFASENWDGEDEDVLLQFATLGKIVYG